MTKHNRKVKLGIVGAVALVGLLSAGLIGDALADSSSSDISVELVSNVSLAIIDSNNVQNLVTMDITPSAAGAFATSSTNIIASSNNTTGYTLTMSDTDADTALHHTNTTVTSTIPTLTAASSEASFPVNHYGYSFNGASDFSPVPALASPVTLATTNASGANTYPFVVGAKVDTSLPSGTYQGTITFSLTANYVPPAKVTLADITNMQEMTSSICADSTVGDTATLTDTRDNKTYVVKKLADNKCWMVQNLYLVGPRTLTPADSNVSANFALPASSTSFGTTDDAAGINIARVNDTSRADYGAYYNWYTATAGTGTYEMSTQGDNATSSVCPKGWRLPKGGAIDTNTGNGEFRQLYDAYGNYTDFISATNAVLSGYWNNSSAANQGSSGYWWSSTVYDATYGYGLYFSTSNVNPQDNNDKRYGYSVRCLAE